MNQRKEPPWWVFPVESLPSSGDCLPTLFRLFVPLKETADKKVCPTNYYFQFLISIFLPFLFTSFSKKSQEEAEVWHSTHGGLCSSWLRLVGRKWLQSRSTTLAQWLRPGISLNGWLACQQKWIKTDFRYLFGDYYGFISLYFKSGFLM